MFSVRFNRRNLKRKAQVIMRNHADVWSLAKEIFVRAAARPISDVFEAHSQIDSQTIAQRSIKAAQIFLTEFSKQSDQEDNNGSSQG